MSNRYSSPNNFCTMKENHKRDEMNKITTPIAVLISGLLIFIGLLILSNSLKDDYFYHVDSTNEIRAWLIRTHKVTGLSCYTHAEAYDIVDKKPPKNRDTNWTCSKDIHQ